MASDVVSSKVELPDLNYIINADFPVNLSLYLNRMRMSNVKNYISIFIAEDARHADRLIYVLNECRQEVPRILYKISEAYINSGKDVDRMPSRKLIHFFIQVKIKRSLHNYYACYLIYSYFIKHKSIGLIYFLIYDVLFRKLFKTLKTLFTFNSKMNKYSKELIGK